MHLKLQVPIQLCRKTHSRLHVRTSHRRKYAYVKVSINVILEISSFSEQSSHAREVCFPGGKCDSNDETDVDAALRETFEELGILPDKLKVWTHMQPIANHKGMTYTFNPPCEASIK